MTDYKWEDEKEKETVGRELVTQALISDRKNFEDRVKGNDLKLEDLFEPRYLVWAHPVGVPFDSSGEDGVSGPLEAIQWALDLHLDGGWDWLVWDRVQDVGFRIDSNSYIYAPLERWAEKYYGLSSLSEKSTAHLRELIAAAQEVLLHREAIGTL